MFRMFRRGRKNTASTASRSYHDQAAALMLVEGRRMCSNCYWWFVPSGEEFVCEGCASGTQGR